MKKTNIIYWVITALFSAFMLFSGLPDLFKDPKAVEFITTKLGYPEYFLPFLGLAKCLGAVAILIPGFPRIKEWAYAGLAYDLIAATYSNLVVDGFQIGITFMILPFGFLIASYMLHHRRLKLKTKAAGHPAAAMA